MELDGKKIVNNIYSKAKELDIKIGDIEKEVPVSLGYFSRFLKDDNHSLPSLESLYVAASKLNVTIDFLLSGNYSDMNEEELLVQEKLSIMILNTTNDKYCWEEIKEKDFYKPIYETDEDRIYPLATLNPHYNHYSQVDYVIKDYYSYFLDKNMTLDGSIFSLEIESKTFYISKIFEEENNNCIYYEFYVKVPIENGMYKICNLVNACSKDKFYSLLGELYKICVLKSQKFRLDVLAINALNSIK